VYSRRQGIDSLVRGRIRILAPFPLAQKGDYIAVSDGDDLARKLPADPCDKAKSPTEYILRTFISGICVCKDRCPVSPDQPLKLPSLTRSSNFIEIL
jgi:hypothetical protein